MTQPVVPDPGPPELVHVITTLGPTNGPGFLVPAQMLGVRLSGTSDRFQVWFGGTP